MLTVQFADKIRPANRQRCVVGYPLGRGHAGGTRTCGHFGVDLFGDTRLNQATRTFVWLSHNQHPCELSDTRRADTPVQVERIFEKIEKRLRRQSDDNDSITNAYCARL